MERTHRHVSELFLLLLQVDVEAHWKLVQEVPSEALQNPASDWWAVQGEVLWEQIVEQLKAKCPTGCVFELRDGRYDFWQVDKRAAAE